MFFKLKPYWENDFLRHNVVFFAGSMLVAVLNYAYHPVVSRMLSVEAFGEVQAYFSLAIQLGVLSGVFGMIILNIKTNYEDDKVKEDIIVQLYTLSTIVSAVTALGLLLLAPYIGVWLKLPNYAGFLLVAGILLVSTPRTFAMFHLQAEKQFFKISLTDFISAAGKIIFAVLLIWAGWAVLGAVAGMLLATLAGLVYVYPYTKHTIGPTRFKWPRFTSALRHELKFGWLVLFATGFSIFLYTSDIIVVRYFFDTDTAGLYAGIATVARIIFFATGSVAGVTIAHVKLSNSRAENHAVMNKALLLISAMALAGWAVFALFPQFIIGLLMGERFLSMADLLPLSAMFMVVVAIANLFIMYFLALRYYALVGIVIFSAGAIAIFTFLWHDTVSQVVEGFLGGIGLMLVVLSVIYLHEKKELA